MDAHVDDVMQLCCEMSSNQQIKATIKGVTKGTIVIGTSAIVGGILFGPPGLAVGGAGGSLLAWLTSGEFKPIPEILMELPPAEKQKLYNDIMSVLGKLNWTDVSQLIALVKGCAALRQQVKATVLSYVKKELGAEVQ